MYEIRSRTRNFIFLLLSTVIVYTGFTVFEDLLVKTAHVIYLQIKNSTECFVGEKLICNPNKNRCTCFEIAEHIFALICGL